LAFFIVYILSCVVHKFFFLRLILAVHQHPHLAFLGPDHHGLIPHAADHVKRIPGFAPKRQLQGVFCNTLLQCLFKGMLDLEEPVGRAKAANPLVRALVVVILDPEGRTFHRLFKAAELGPLQIFILDRFPEPFDLAQGHGMVGAGLDVPHPVFFKLAFKPGGPAPVGVLAPVVGQYLFGDTVFTERPAVGLQHVFGRLAAVKPQPRDVAGIIIHEADQVRVAPCQAEGHDIALPQLVGPGALKEPGFGRILFRLCPGPGNQSLLGEGFVNAR
jgi:hypothetical protein